MINLNEWVYINTDNPTPSVGGRDIAINIVPSDKGVKHDLENYVLAIDDWPQCCEDYGTGNLITSGAFMGQTVDALVDPVYVYTIETDIEVSDAFKQQYNIAIYDEMVEYSTYAVRLQTNIGTIEAAVYNFHNGYYSHTIYYSDDTLKIDVTEEHWL